jgi:hypothetical protein
MSMTKDRAVPALQVGHMVKAKMATYRVSLAWLGRKLNRNPRTLARSLSGNSMQAYLIWELSIALRHNFFSDLARQLDAATEGKLEQQHTALQQLQADYERLKEERDYLRKALDLISK